MSRQRDFLITVSDFDGPFQTLTGGATTAESTKEFDGGSDVPTVLTGPPVTDDVVVGRRWDGPRDNREVKRHRSSVGVSRHTITCQPVDGRGIPEGEPIVRTGILVRITDPEVDRNGNGPAKFEVGFAIESVS